MPLIIFVDDNEDDFLLFQEAVNEISNQCIVNFARCGNDFFELLNAVTPQLIFLDVNFPETSGIACLKKIRAVKKYDSIPIVMYSASDEFLEECYSQKATYYVKKPSSFLKILAAFKSILTSKEPKFRQPLRENFLIE